MLEIKEMSLIKSFIHTLREKCVTIEVLKVLFSSNSNMKSKH